MKSPPFRNHRGFSLIEVLVAFFITLILTGAVYKILTGMRRTAALSNAKGQAKEMATFVLKAIEKDLSATHAYVDPTNPTASVTTSLVQSGNTFSMLVAEAESYKKITYDWDGSKNLFRDDASTTRHLLCDKVTSLVLTLLSVEQYQVELKVAIVPDGTLEPQIHHQSILVNIKEAGTAYLDPRFRNTTDVLKNY